MADDLKVRLRALAHERLQAEMHDHIPARCKKHQKLRIALAEGADRITALEDHARALAEALRPFSFVDEEYDDIGDDQTIELIEPMRCETLNEIKMAAFRKSRAALAEHQKIMGGK